MLTRLTVRNFKRFDEAAIELGSPVVFIGPNNSGKTSAMQALALWDIGLRRWNERRGGRSAPERRPGVTVNRRDLFAIPVPAANLLWREPAYPRRKQGCGRETADGQRARRGRRGRRRQRRRVVLRAGVRLRQRGVVLLPPAASRRGPGRRSGWRCPRRPGAVESRLPPADVRPRGHRDAARSGRDRRARRRRTHRRGAAQPLPSHPRRTARRLGAADGGDRASCSACGSIRPATSSSAARSR